MEIRVFNPLFSAEFPGAKNVTTNSNDNSESIIEDGDAEEELDADANEPSWTKELNPDSEVIYPNALVDQYMIDSKLEPLSRFQFERIGYFVVDYDSDLENNRFVFNRTVALKSSKDKK